MNSIDRPPEASISGDAAADLPERLPLVPLREFVLFPHMVAPMVVLTPQTKRIMAELNDRAPHFIVALQRKPEIDEDHIAADDLHDIGCVVRLVKTLNFPDGSIHVLVEGLSRCRISAVRSARGTPPSTAFEMLEEPQDDTPETEALARVVSERFQQVVAMSSNLPDELALATFNATSPSHLADLVAANLPIPLDERQRLLAESRPAPRLARLMEFINREYQVLKLGSKIESKVHETFAKTQREMFLREQLNAIRKELGEEDPQAAELEELSERIAAAGLPKEARAAAEKELRRLRSVPAASPEHGVIHTYLDLLADLPWKRRSDDRLDVAVARKILDREHYGLKEVKERILEHLSVLKLKKDMKGPILCLVGPPGVGKTSLGRSVAHALNRKFVRMSLGGMHDEAEIRGHRRTYVGAMPGRIVESLRRCGANNPVFILDEIDKVGQDFRGDPSSALLEVLDPEQNFAFNDYYLDVPFDLSRILFITTANVLDTIPEPLRDRMEIIRISGYVLEEKVRIARRYLVPKNLKAHGLKRRQLAIGKEALEALTEKYTSEAGVRELDRRIAAICRKVARGIAEGNGRPVEVTPRKLKGFLGPVRIERDVAERKVPPGIVTGLAWTPRGGEILFVEATRMAGKGELILTGSLGDVMKESARAALSYLRANASTFGIDPARFGTIDVHVHVPAGATPKDGPSAGIAMTLALLSMLTDRPVRSDLAMTGEISLRGRVLPVGGIKEKVMAAARAGIRHVILPEKNKIDLDEIPKEIRRKLTFKPFRTVDRALRYALEL